MLDPEISTLRLFIKICEERNLARVALDAKLSASAISKRISKLEADLNSPPLLKRNRYGLTPTSAGFALLARSQSLVQAADDLLSDQQAFNAQGNVTVTVLTSGTLLSANLPLDIAEFLKLPGHQDIGVRLDMSHNSEGVLYGVRENQSTIGVLWDRLNLSDMVVKPYRVHQSVVAVPKGHALCERSEVRFKDLLEFDFVGHRTTQAAEAMFRRNQMITAAPLRYRMLAWSPETALRMVGQGLGITVLPSEVVQTYLDTFDLAMIPLNERWATQKNVVCLSKDRQVSGATLALADF